MVLDKMMMEVWNKWAIKFGHREGQRDRDITDRPTGFEVHRINI